MAEYQILVKAWSGPIEALLNKIDQIEALEDRLIDEEILPALARNFDRSGIHSHSGHLYKAVTQRGATGNMIVKNPRQIVVGVDYQAIPYAKWVIEGRGEVRARNKKALAFDLNGKRIIVKSVRAAPPHEIYELNAADLDKIESRLNELVMEAIG